ncbi:SRPBCC family protein [Asanoa siamensis]|uniref:Polyketide cyclase/dehydrase/lipid transport protein n=1 Tax=Asanoa siamensis TaxID=926357 RepID=A0ABQ4D2V8_9ACTN|nr:SRPBCC family protein [Asanoa siamensis]GIF77830.1 hypothetical protein Asi02nite_73480 [Asanoa siamensis]
MVKVQVREMIATSPEEFLGLVMDIERYAQFDDKIRPILWSRRDGNRVEFACRPKLAGLRHPRVVQFLELTPNQRIDIGLLPKPRNKLAHRIAHFEASFECVPVGDGVRVTRTLEFRFVPAVRWLMDPLFRRRLERDVRVEIGLAKRHLEGT